MNKREVFSAVAVDTGVSRSCVETVLNSFLGVVTAALASGEEIRLKSFGIFRVKRRAARVGRNPRTDEAVAIGERKSVTFKPGKGLTASVDTGRHSK